MNKAEEPGYKVVLSGKTLPERSRDEALEGLAGLFNSTAAAMERVLQGHPTPLKKEYSESQATELCRKIERIGAQCEIREIRIEKTVEEIVEGVVEEAEEVAEETVGRKMEIIHEEHSEREDHPEREDRSEKADSAEREDHPERAGRSEGEDSSGSREYEEVQGLLMGFVYVNTDYYRRQFARFGDPARPSFRLSWHWPAFFFFFFWALYRKMWLVATFYLIVGTSVTLMATGSPGSIFSLFWLFFWPCVANWLYYRKAVFGVHRAMEHPEMKSDYMSGGGVSKGMVWVGVVIMIVLSVWMGNHVARQFVEEYGEEIAGVLPGSGTQVTRDGAVVNVTPQSGAGLVESSLTLSYLATTLKLLIVTKGNTDNNAAVTGFIEKLNQGEYTDGWGNEILVTQEVDRYVLFSAGPDQTYGTGDDILQAVDLRQ